jgi:hypothetical protein
VVEPDDPVGLDEVVPRLELDDEPPHSVAHWLAHASLQMQPMTAP